MTAEPGFRISSDATFLSLHSLQAVHGTHSASRPYLGPIWPPNLIWGPFRLQAVSGAHSASRPYLGPIRPPSLIWGPFRLQAISGARSASRPYLGPIQPPGRIWGLFSLQVYLGFIQPQGRIWGPYSLQAVAGARPSPGRIWGLHSLQAMSGAHTASRPYLGPIQPPDHIWGPYSLQAVSGAHSASRPYLGPIQPPIQCLPGDLFLGVKGLGYEAEKSSQFSAKVKNTWSFISAPPCVVMVSCLIRHTDRRTFSLMQAALFVKSHAGFEVVTEVFLNFQLFLKITRSQLVKSHRRFGRC
jgi:hypothetical protein